MIKKKSNAYEKIKCQIAKLTIIQLVTGFSPRRLVAIYLKNNNDFKGKMEVDELASDSAYKYFKRESAIYLSKNRANQDYRNIFEFVNSNYLCKSYFGLNYSDIRSNFKNEEFSLKAFVSAEFIRKFPITLDMSKSDIAVRNQKLGKISVNNWIGDISNYEYFHQAPDTMIRNVNKAILTIEMFIFYLLNDNSLDIVLTNFSTNQKLQTKLLPKQQSLKENIIKI